jgi:hypothetical protein
MRNKQSIPFDLELAKAGHPILFWGDEAEFVAHVPKAHESQRVVVVRKCDGTIYATSETGSQPSNGRPSLTMAPKPPLEVVKLFVMFKNSLGIVEVREVPNGLSAPDMIPPFSTMLGVKNVTFTEGEYALAT